MVNENRTWRSLRAFGVLVLLALGTPALLLANGGTLRLANVPMGEYRVSVFTDPTPVRPDSLDVSVLVLQDELDGLPEGVDVEVHAELLEWHGDPAEEERPATGAPHVLAATREQADDPRYHAAKFVLGAAGVWRISVFVQGEAGSGDASFEVTARERGLLRHPLTIIVLALLPLAGAAWWILREDPGDATAE